MNNLELDKLYLNNFDHVDSLWYVYPEENILFETINYDIHDF